MSEIIIAGAAILDVLVQPASKKVFETGSYAAERITMSTGGDAMNEAAVLAKLGAKPALAGILGADDAGNSILEQCHNMQIDTSMVLQKENLDTGINVVLIDEQGERHFLTNPHGSLRKLTLEDVQLSIEEDMKILNFASIFVFPLLKDKEMAAVLQKGKEQGLICCADMTKCKNGETTEDIRETLSKLDYLFANQEEAGMVTRKQNPEEMAEELLASGVKNVVLKLGKEGCLIKNKENTYQIPTYTTENCVDTTGAGDSFAAGFLYALANGYSLEECGMWGNACGSLAVECVGATTGIIDLPQVKARFEALKNQRRK